MSKTGLMIASGLNKAVDNFFKAREARDLQAQKNELFKIKQQIQLQDLYNSQRRGDIYDEQYRSDTVMNPLKEQFQQDKTDLSKIRTNLQTPRFKNVAEYLDYLADPTVEPEFKINAFSQVMDRAPTEAELKNIVGTSQYHLGQRKIQTEDLNMDIMDQELEEAKIKA